MRSTVRSILVLIVVVFTACTYGGDTAGVPWTRGPGRTEVRVGAATRPVPLGFVGFNGTIGSGERGVWLEEGFRAAVERLQPGTIRIFGGTTANYWDWRSGEFVRDRQVPDKFVGRDEVAPPLHLEDFVRVLEQSGAVPLFNLNVVTSTLDEQLAMLRAARSLGLPIERVELGNELYFPHYRDEYPTAERYAAMANEWAVAIKSEFPDAQVAAVADVPRGDSGRRVAEWNERVLPLLHEVDAVTIHVYFESGLGQQGLDGPAGLTSLLRAADERWREAERSVIERVPPGLEVWVTEWSAPAPGRWGQGLAVASLAVRQLLEPKIGLSVYHSLVGSGIFTAIFPSDHGLAFEGFSEGSDVRTERYGFSAVGWAMSQFAALLDGATSASPLEFAPVRLSDGTVVEGTPLLGAWVVGKQSGGVIVNQSSHPVTAALPPELQGLRYGVLSAAPNVLVASSTSLEASDGTTGRFVELAPYSVTRFGG